MTENQYTSVGELQDQMNAWWAKGKFSGELVFDVGERLGLRDMVTTILYTRDHRYHLTAFFSDGMKRSSLLGSFNTRRSEVGEGHCRGNDISDGPFTEETWNEIMADIVSNECIGSAGSEGSPSGIKEEVSQ